MGHFHVWINPQTPLPHPGPYALERLVQNLPRLVWPRFLWPNVVFFFFERHFIERYSFSRAALKGCVEFPCRSCEVESCFFRRVFSKQNHSNVFFLCQREC